ncbi:aldolase [Bacillus sp. JJ1566]|uniref:aldolase n=1 Tax=Bacillus sp. JJ1566 TaxID=3122961 RepID=UPI002FFEC568
MINTRLKFCYKAFGLNLMTELEFPELIASNIENSHIDVEIQFVDLTAKWNELVENDQFIIINHEFVMFRIPNTAIFSIERGKRIFISKEEGVHAEQIRLYVLGTCMGALLMQRKILPLHGSAVAINGKAYAIVGESGAGKSTLATAFLNKGYELLSDDVIPVSMSNNNIPIVTPAYPQQKLWEESLQAFGMDAKSLYPIAERETKFAVPVISQFYKEDIPLGGVFELVKSEDLKINIKPILNLHRLQTLFQHTYRNFLLTSSGMLEWHFSFITTLANRVNLYQINRPVSLFTATDLASMILSAINEGDNN